MLSGIHILLKPKKYSIGQIVVKWSYYKSLTNSTTMCLFCSKWLYMYFPIFTFIFTCTLGFKIIYENIKYFNVLQKL